MHKRINLPIILIICSRIFLIISFAFLLCAFVSWLYNEEIWVFLSSAAISSFLSGFTFYFYKRKKTPLQKIRQREAFLTVSIAWLCMGLIGSVPYLLSGSIPSFIDALFESISGFTTTGSSILSDIESLPKSILFWRSLTHWIGGIGIIVLVIIIMPKLQVGGYRLFTLESSLQEKIKPRTIAVGYRLLYIYLFLTFLEVLLLLAGNMNFYESLCHSFGTIATGGFSPKNSSIGDYSPYIQYIITVFMFLGGTNFLIHYYTLHRQTLKVKSNQEFKLYSFFILLIGTIISLSLFFDMGKNLETSFREGFFQVVSIITCTGYATADYMLWPQYAWILIFFAMFLGGSTGSTAGGIKILRHLVFFKNISRTFRQIVHPKAILEIRVNNKTINEESNTSILSFMMLYLVIFLSASISLRLIGLPNKEAFSAIATSMAGIGPGLGEIGPAGNFSLLPNSAKIILCFTMLLGRLEIYPLLILFSRIFWKR
jgi:trk system potassium uptake protein TrkH